MPQEPTPLRKLWNAIGFIGDLQTLWGLLVAFGFASVVTSKLPGGWHPPQYWLVAGTAFVAGWLIVRLLSGAATWTHHRWRPVKCAVAVFGGEDVHLMVTNTGSTVVSITAMGQVVGADEGVRWKRVRPFTLGYLKDAVVKPGESHQVRVVQAYFGEMHLVGDGLDQLDKWAVGTGYSMTATGRWIRIQVTIRSEPAMPKVLKQDFSFCYCQSEYFIVRVEPDLGALPSG